VDGFEAVVHDGTLDEVGHDAALVDERLPFGDQPYHLVGRRGDVACAVGCIAVAADEVLHLAELAGRPAFAAGALEEDLVELPYEAGGDRSAGAKARDAIVQ